MSHSHDGAYNTPEVSFSLDQLVLAADHILVEIPKSKDTTAGGIALPESFAKKSRQVARIVKIGDYHAETVESKSMGFPAVGLYVVVSDHHMDDPDFKIGDDEYRIIDWQDLTHVWRA